MMAVKPMECLEFEMSFRWFTGLELDGRVWGTTMFTKNRERVLNGDPGGTSPDLHQWFTTSDSSFTSRPEISRAGASQ